MKLEVVVVPVADVDRAKDFYQGLGWRLDIDAGGGDFRAVQLTPPGANASIIFGKGVTSARPGSIEKLVLAVDDIDATSDELLSRGVEVSEVFHDASGSLAVAFSPARRRAPPVEIRRRSYASDCNGWLLQEIKERLPGRV
jgi:catechol 2,3-dioxygenase-like lactoylglutathione lyase family enzyme